MSTAPLRLALAAVFAGAASALLAQSAAPLAQTQAPSLAQMQQESQRVAGRFIDMLGGELRRELKASGPLRSVLVCKFYAPEVASKISRETGWRVSRVTLRPRNPALGYADAWEQKVLLGFDRRVARGEKAEELEYTEVVDEPQGKVFRYMKALPMGPLCTQCHGTASDMSAFVQQEIAREYPFDKATGYRVGEVRGAVSVKRPL